MGIKEKSKKRVRNRNKRTIKITRQPEDYENIKYNGILEIPKLSQKTEEFILNQYVLDSMNRKDNHLSKEELMIQSPLLLKETLRYLTLRNFFRGRFGPPSILVDYFWHTFILCTEMYEEFCKTALNGKFLHHDPGLFLKGTKKGDNGYETTLKLYVRFFKNIPPISIWGRNEENDKMINSVVKSLEK